ncbi:hypothetical protein PoB_004824200 [Plakobranchus ocellatus]|uniref:Uncharacterized protein n=1 Tax=Plakobranchus ocellatus TaxID=259542 RepID=A0AAV4BRX9_9GAST|nr:hypothetical protein PoB_004824200 [Plakobranchus ocellatus]
MAANRNFTLGYFRKTAAMFIAVFVWSVEGQTGNNAIEWTGLKHNYGHKVASGQMLVDLSDITYRQCVRMCWLLRICAALTSIPKAQRCMLYRLMQKGADGYKAEPEAGSLAVDIREAAMDIRKVRYCARNHYLSGNQASIAGFLGEFN